jgi:hypothetical protein
VAIAWDAGRVTRAEVTPLKARTCTVLHGAERYRVEDEAGRAVPTRTDGHRLLFEAEAGRTYALVPTVGA